MSIVSFELFKKHTRSDDFADDDELLQQYLDAAEVRVIRATGRTEAELTEMGGGRFPADLVQVIIMLGAHWYNQRESVSNVQMHSVPEASQAIIKSYRKLVKDDSGKDEIHTGTDTTGNSNE